MKAFPWPGLGHSVKTLRLKTYPLQKNVVKLADDTIHAWGLEGSESETLCSQPFRYRLCIARNATICTTKCNAYVLILLVVVGGGGGGDASFALAMTAAGML